MSNWVCKKDVIEMLDNIPQMVVNEQGFPYGVKDIKYKKALEIACKYMAEGKAFVCPYDAEYVLWNSCEECANEPSKCWLRYFLEIVE